MIARFTVLTLLSLWPLFASAYPEYAVRLNVMKCTACHISPVGGGPRTVYGKLYGAHGYKINPVLAQDYVSADFRALYYLPDRAKASRDGMGIMSASVAGHAPLDADKRIHLVIEHNFGGFAAAPYRDTYALFNLGPEGAKPRWADSVLIGRFRVPFGLITDEHRTYVRVQSATEWYTFETGALLSGTPTDKLHYDVAVVNGENQTGQTLNKGAANRWGTVLNVRYMPGPVMLGTSFSYHDHEPARESRQAASLYALLSVGRWTNDRIPAEFRFEHVTAKNWGANLGQGFAKDPAYVTSLKTSRSEGWLMSMNYRLSERFSLIYKYDLLTPDKKFASDFYQRHGFGFWWSVGPNVVVQARTELAQATHPSEAGSTGEAGQNASFLILQLSL